jgi:hypothetical protein
MSLKKIKEKNPGVEFSTKASKKASDAVKKNSLTSQLNVDTYNQKYSSQVAKKDSAKESAKKKLNDKAWKFVQQVPSNKNTDSFKESKGGFYDEKGDKRIEID